jgi:hypothetical protein
MVVAVESDLSAMNIPSNGSEWAELVVKEMFSALDLVDAKNRAFRLLDLFEKSTAACISPVEMRKMREVTNTTPSSYNNVVLNYQYLPVMKVMEA